MDRREGVIDGRNEYGGRRDGRRQRHGELMTWARCVSQSTFGVATDGRNDYRCGDPLIRLEYW
jgi:hypothetical protein